MKAYGTMFFQKTVIDMKEKQFALNIKCCIIIIFLFICLKGNAENYFTRPLKEKSVCMFIEAGLGYNYYSSPGGLYETNQPVYYASGILGYRLNSFFLGLGGTASRHTEEHLYSFKAFFNARYSLNKVSLTPYVELLGGCVGYLKWNDFVKPYYGIGAGVHLLPRLCSGLRVANVGTLDNNGSWEYSLYLSFIIGK